MGKLILKVVTDQESIRVCTLRPIYVFINTFIPRQPQSLLLGHLSGGSVRTSINMAAEHHSDCRNLPGRHQRDTRYV
eukprot:scaffold101894_cov31-Prasinocladus_malaysianus.AAC.2